MNFQIRIQIETHDINVKWEYHMYLHKNIWNSFSNVDKTDVQKRQACLSVCHYT